MAAALSPTINLYRHHIIPLVNFVSTKYSTLGITPIIAPKNILLIFSLRIFMNGLCSIMFLMALRNVVSSRIRIYQLPLHLLLKLSDVVLPYPC
jgi:hypothetical protein